MEHENEQLRQHLLTVLSTSEQVRNRMRNVIKHVQNSYDRTETLEKENKDMKSKIKILSQRLHKAHQQTQSMEEERDDLLQMTSNLTTRVLRADERTREMDIERHEAIDMIVHALLRVDTVENQRDIMKRNLDRTTNELNVLKRLCNELHATPIPIDTPILVMQEKWIEMFRKHKKKLEIRGQNCLKEIGTTIFLTPSRSDKLTDTVEFGGSREIISDREWNDLRPQHRNPDPRRRYDENTYAWKLDNCVNLKTPISYKVYSGSVIWRKYFPPY